MESLSLRDVITVTNHSFRARRSHTVNPIHLQSHQPRIRRPCISSKTKISDFQDFQGYARPSRLLPTTKVKTYKDTLHEDTLPSLDGSGSVFKVKIKTSGIYGSHLTNISAAVLLCLIDEHGNSVLQRIPASLTTEPPNKSQDEVASEVLHFQRNSVDEFIFGGPKLGNIDALWIGVESGQWRLGGVSLTIIASEADKEKPLYTARQCEFNVEDILLGEASDASMVELRPCLKTELCGSDPFNLLSRDTPQLNSMSSPQISNEESMREYMNLKLSLLLYDALLTLFGSSIAYLTVGDNAAFAFFIGGLGGFFYLLLLQRSVDELPSPVIISGNPDGGFGKLKGQISSLALAIGFAAIAVKFGLGGASASLTPKDLLVGMLGFLACKVAVVLAAFKPVGITEEGK